MVFPAPYPGPPTPSRFVPAPPPVTPEEDDSMAQWAQVSGYVQPKPVDTTSLNFESLDALFAWELGGAVPEPTLDFELGGGLGLDWTTGEMPAIPDYMAAAPAPAPVPPPLPATINFEDLLDLEWDSTSLPTPVLTDVSSTTSPQSDSTGDYRFPFPTYEAAASQNASSAAPPPNFDFPDFFQSEQVACTPPSWVIGDGIDFTMETQPGYADLMGIYGNPYLIEPDITMPINASAAMEIATTEGVGVSEKVLGKRRRERYGFYRIHSAGPDNDNSSGCELPQKRGRTTTAGVLEAAGSTKRTSLTHATKTQTNFNGKSKVVGCGAGRLASTTARGVYHRSLLGHSVLQGSVVSLAQGQPPWTEEREQEATGHDTQEAQNPEIAEDLEAIPEKMTAWQRSLLETTSADEERGAVRTIKCRLCPGEQFKTWPCFARHCRDNEQHPEKINCCDRCGIYFGRQDSMKRHRNSGTKACCTTTPAEAAWRKHKAEQLLEDFQKRVEDWLRTGGELGPKFAAIARAELPSTSKKMFLSKRTKSGGSNSDGR